MLAEGKCQHFLASFQCFYSFSFRDDQIEKKYILRLFYTWHSNNRQKIHLLS